MADPWAERHEIPQRPALVRERYVCPYPECGWFHEDEGVTPDDYVGTTVSVRIAPEHRPSIGWAARGDIGLNALHQAAIRAHAERLEATIRGHLDLDHPGWTLESVVMAVDAYNERMRAEARHVDGLREHALEDLKHNIDRQIADQLDARGRYDHGTVLDGEIVRRDH